MSSVLIGEENSDHLAFSDFQGGNPADSNYTSEDWIYCTVHIAAGKFTGAFREMFQLKEFKSLLGDLISLAGNPARIVHFQAIEQWVDFKMTIDRLGHICVEGNAVASHEDGNRLSFQMKLDNMALSNAIKGLKRLQEHSE